jgi:serine/threonine protein kinase
MHLPCILGSRSGGQAPLDWVTRARIALGAAKGLAYLHQEAGGGGASAALKLGSQLAHGNIKSSNILLTQELEAGVSDFGLVQLVGITASAAAVGSRNLGYCAPEVTETHRLTFMSDVYSFGVVCLSLYGTFVPSYSLLVFFLLCRFVEMLESILSINCHVKNPILKIVFGGEFLLGFMS